MTQEGSAARSRARLFGAVALAMQIMMTVETARAQETPEVTAGQVDEIVVTAQRREENIQDVPLSVATIQSDQLQTIFDAGGDITALATRVPGLYAESSNGRVAPRFYIRGLGNTDFDLAASQPVSVIVDDVVLENVALKSTPIFDIQSVEVLRGPQGTLFGRNTPAGIIKFSTVKPSNEFSAQASLSAGSYATVNFDAGIGGPIIPDKLAARVSLLYQHRNDWIDNGFTGENNAYGRYDEIAARGQVLLTPTEEFSALANIHYRRFEGYGAAAVFRANILGPGNNDLNANFQRDTVFLDAGGGNYAQYRGWGSSLKLDYDFGGAVLTSITAYETTEGSSRADVDGGNPGGPGFIPFPSDTQDSLNLDQWTQEVRLASSGSGPLSWQVGGFYFDSDFTVLTEGFTFPPPTLVRHKNQSWAVFGQASYKLTEAFKVTGGVRYTEDDKQFNVIGGSPTNDRSVSDERVSWDVSAMYEVASDVSLYGRVASGFRAPSIQGRDVAFFNPPSVAGSEKILSWEAGFKTQLADRRIRLNGAVFTYTVTDPQFTAVGGSGNLVQLLNANKGKAWGFEVDSEFRPVENLTFTAGVSYNNTKIDDPNLAVGICAQCTVTDPLVTIAGTPRALVDGNPFPNAPEWIVDVTARYAIPVGDGEIFAFTDWAYQGYTNFFLYQSKEFYSDGQFEGGLRIGYAKRDGSFEIAAFARNITDEENVKGGIDFNNNTGFVNEPRVFGLSLRTKIN
ncbi:TonB-dependent receptor [Sphingomonas sp. JC676]|uniref:TonB-dependent receptor n=1 Tax=Sphingomonas sp. JC676 TaxID=2768065 RepID=UPI001657B92F|nr:TonB-dependent receptor [Sphingomonas sp. JC676]MBC9032114.1 TonB-dependent receptor [Sphingomonas sp. JC676]